MRCALVLASNTIACGQSFDDEVKLSSFFTVEARITPGMSADAAVVFMTVDLASIGEDGAAVDYCGEARVFLGDSSASSLSRLEQQGPCGDFVGSENGYADEYRLLIERSGETAVDVRVRSPVLHSVSFEPLEPRATEVAKVHWSPSGEGDVRAMGWYWSNASSAETVLIGGEADDGIGSFVFPQCGESTFGILRLREISLPEAGVGYGGVQLTVEEKVSVL